MYICNICKRDFVYESEISEHLLHDHNLVTEDNSTWIETHYCWKCRKETRYKITEGTHVIKKGKCLVCGNVTEYKLLWD